MKKKKREETGFPRAAKRPKKAAFGRKNGPQAGRGGRGGGGSIRRGLDGAGSRWVGSPGAGRGVAQGLGGGRFSARLAGGNAENGGPGDLRASRGPFKRRKGRAGGGGRSGPILVPPSAYVTPPGERPVRGGGAAEAAGEPASGGETRVVRGRGNGFNCRGDPPGGGGPWRKEGTTGRLGLIPRFDIPAPDPVFGGRLGNPSRGGVRALWAGRPASTWRQRRAAAGCCGRLYKLWHWGRGERGGAGGGTRAGEGAMAMAPARA